MENLTTREANVAFTTKIMNIRWNRMGPGPKEVVRYMDETQEEEGIEHIFEEDRNVYNNRNKILDLGKNITYILSQASMVCIF